MSVNTIPMDLRNYIAVDPPRFKKEYPGQLLRVHTLPPHYGSFYNLETQKRETRQGKDLIPDGAVFRLRQRYPDGNGDATLVLDWDCPCCLRTHERDIKESWLDEDKAEFVRECDLAQGNAGDILYLATPYSHESAQVMQERWLAVSAAAAWLMHRGYTVLSPISMGHPVGVMANHAGLNQASDFAAWESTCIALLSAATHLVVLLAEGVERSVGVKAEMDYARKKGLPIWGLRQKGEAYAIEPFLNLTFEG